MDNIKILVFSDSHGREHYIEKAIEAHGGRADALIFLGDGIAGANRVFEKYPNIPHVSVKGNCDFMADGEVDEAQINLGGVNILCTHGHKYSVKSTLMSAGLRARERGCGLLLFGHTHERCEIRTGELIYFNPGSIGQGYPKRSYGVINICGENIICHHGTVE